MSGPKIVCLHAGTHKTGTKTLQTFWAVNARPLAAAGIFVPNTGRAPLGDGARSPGHHVIAWQALGEMPGDELPALLDEIARANAPLAIVSSEDFQYLHDRPEAVARLIAGFSSIGYETRLLFYLRAQPWYAQSLYGELTKAHHAPHVCAFFREIITTGRHAPHDGTRILLFRYSELLGAFAACAGDERIVARAYQADAGDALLRDFFTVAASWLGSLSLTDLQNPLPRANESISLGTLLANIAASIGSEVETSTLASPERLERRFSLVTRDEAEAFVTAFGEDNRMVGERAGITIPFQSLADVPASDDPMWIDALECRGSIDRVFSSRV